jgi:hypothetical protein
MKKRFELKLSILKRLVFILIAITVCKIRVDNSFENQ